MRAAHKRIGCSSPSRNVRGSNVRRNRGKQTRTGRLCRAAGDAKLLWPMLFGVLCRADESTWIVCCRAQGTSWADFCHVDETTGLPAGR